MIVLHNAPTMTQCKIAAQPPITTIHKVSSMPPRQYSTSSPRVAHHNINPLPRLAGATWQYHSPVLAARMLSVVQGLKSFRSTRNRIRTAELCCDFSVSSYQTVKESGRSSCTERLQCFFSQGFSHALAMPPLKILSTL